MDGSIKATDFVAVLWHRLVPLVSARLVSEGKKEEQSS